MAAARYQTLKRPQRKSLSTREQLRSVGGVRLEITSLDETMIARVTSPPGWRWSVDMKPIVGAPSCQNRHLGVCLSGTLHVVATTAAAGSGPDGCGLFTTHIGKFVDPDG